MATLAPLGAFQEVSLPQGMVRYSDQGTGPTLVFLHGLLANSLLWSRVIPRLALSLRGSRSSSGQPCSAHASRRGPESPGGGSARG
jgi:pimeloyl-ACP methyl ester carboxylesterase